MQAGGGRVDQVQIGFSPKLKPYDGGEDFEDYDHDCDDDNDDDVDDDNDNDGLSGKQDNVVYVCAQFYQVPGAFLTRQVT